jgi:hypothetical protein
MLGTAEYCLELSNESVEEEKKMRGKRILFKEPTLTALGRNSTAGISTLATFTSDSPAHLKSPS